MGNLKKQKLYKCIVSTITAIVMLAVSMPSSEIFESTKSLFNDIRVAAEEAVGFTVDEANKLCTITSYPGLAAYSKAYQNEPEKYSTYNVQINMQGESDLTEFESIGTEKCPFRAKLLIPESNLLNLSLDKPFFNYIYDTSAILNVDNENAISVITLSRAVTNAESVPLFANNVVHDEDASDDTSYPQWSIIAGCDSGENSLPHDFSGIIGTIKENANVVLTIRNDAVKTETSTEKIYGNISSTGDVGLACGTMEENSKLTVTIEEEGENDQYSVTSSDGNAGGLIGKMESGSTLTIDSNVDTPGVIEGKYAGGLVGTATDAEIEFHQNSESENNEYYKVTAKVEGTTATGGVFGCYINNIAGRTFQNYNTECDVIGSNAGGVFGELQNNMSGEQPGSITFDNTNMIETSRSSGASTNYGGLIGVYNSSDSACALNITGTDEENPLFVTVSKNGTAENYGGVIGQTTGCSYVKCSNVKVTATGCASNVTAFGGFIGKSGGGKIDINNFTVSTDSNKGFLGGGVIGNMGNGGVLQFSGYTDLSETKCSDSSGNYGQIVGIRGNQTLVYALNSWKLIRSTTPVRADDIGTWGEVLRFNDDFNIKDVLTNNDDHTVTVNYIEVTGTNNQVTVSSLADFAIVALNLKAKWQDSDGYALKFSDYTKLKNIDNSSNLVTLTITNNIDLRGTGLTGLYRDDGLNAAGGSGVFNFKGSIDGTGHTITMASGEPYGYRMNGDILETIDSEDISYGNGRIYRHRYAGLVTKICGEATFENLKIAGNIWVEPRRAIGGSEMFIGSFAAQNVASAQVTFTNIESTVAMDLGTSDSGIITKCGGLIGEFYDYCKVDLTGSVISPEINFINTGGTMYVGGVLGNVQKKNLTINIENTQIGAKIENSGVTENTVTAGGIIAFIDILDSSNRIITLNDVRLNGVEITGSNNAALIGSIWRNVNVTFGGEAGALSVTDCKLGGGNIYAGLVTQGSGYWQVNGVNIDGITVDGNSATSFGMFVNNNDTTGNKSLYIEFTDKDAYKITGDALTLNKVTVFDEIMAYARSDKSNAVNGNCSVVSIHTEDSTGKATVIMDEKNCNTYQHQTNFLNDSANESKRYNPYVRYYYNLDTMRESPDDDPEKLLVWSVNRYAHDSLKQYFSVAFFNETKQDDGRYSYTIPSGNYDMEGYSYYPIDIVDSVTIGDTGKTSIKFYNNEFDASESAAGNSDEYARLTYDATNMNQHYQMQSGLFRNCSGSVTMNNVSLGGNIGKAVSGNAQSGAIISGIMSGSNDSHAELVCNDLTLDGIVVNGVDSSAKKVPLLIYEINKNSKLTINGLNTSENYNTDEKTRLAASSLIGNVGDTNSSNPDNIKVVFNKIVLDSRKNRFGVETIDSAFDIAYKTKNSIFNNATLINSYFYPTGNNCSAVYNYRYEEDWDSEGNPLHQVTYGKEITDSQEYKDENGDSLERNYLNSEYFTNPEMAKQTTPYNFNTDTFLPYVKDYNKGYGGYTTHEVKVNVPSPNFDEGCGTYNDPYIISSANQLDMLSDFGFTDGTIINYHQDNYKSWCDMNDENSKHTTYIKEGDNFYPAINNNGMYVADTDQDGISDDDMKSLLSTAYYKIEGNSNIILKDTFKGIGKNLPFMGVIDGNNNTIINENTVPFIYNSKGSVVKDLDLEIKSAFTTSESGDSKYETDGDTCPFYGGLIGIVNGGDNIIDHVGVTFSEASEIEISSTTNPGNIAIGGYIGVVRSGGVVFRNMEDVTDKSGLTESDNYIFCEGAEINGYMDFKSTDGKIYLYCNPIIGRVIDGYAVTETDSPYSADSSTMDNGIKNYSIADINKSSTAKVSFTALEDDGVNYKVTVPDSQALFLMGCITMSGAGKYDLSSNEYPTSNQLFGYGSSQMVRHGDYDDIGTATSSDDFTNNVAAGDLYSGDIVPYLVYKYTAESVTDSTEKTYPARTLTSSAVFDIEFTGSEEYTLPQGFRGIGSLNDTQGELVSSNNVYTTDSITTVAQPNECSQMKLRNITGNNAVINLNISYYSYSNTYDKYTRNFVTGLGLFNTLLQNCNAENGVIENFTIKGDIKADKFNEDGSTGYTTDCFHIGGLAGTAFGDLKCDINFNNVDISDLTIDSRSSHAAGGLIGYLRSNNGDSAFTATNCGASDVTVNSYRHAGGLVGYTYDYSTTIGTESETIQINNVSPQVISTVGKWQSLNCAGCVIGGTYNKNHTLKNIAITGGTITADGTNTAAGSLIGCTNDINATGVTGGFRYEISSITVNGVNIYTESTTNIVYSGGLIGAAKAVVSAECNISDCTVAGQSAENKNTIKGISIAGGLIAVDCQKTTIDNCSLENYILIANISDNNNPCGGLIGKVQSYDTILKNSYIKNCTIKYDGKTSDAKRIGGIAGLVTDSITFSGYNIAVKDVDIVYGNTTNVGTAIGGLNSTASVKLVGVSISGVTVNDNTGNTFGASQGTNSYVICSDMEGTCLSESPNEDYSTVNYDTSTSVSDYGKTSPYATINPKTVMGSDETFFLTGDGASSAVQESLKDNAAFENYNGNLSTFQAETRANISNDFPVLVVNDSNNANVTKMINSYIHLLTNDSTYNYAADNNSIYTVNISQYRYDESTATFQTDATYKQTLARKNSQFGMSNEDYDSNYKQFTLLDIQYLDPIPTGTGQITYHLYIPVMVEKMLKYDFTAEILSGTTYKAADYANRYIALESYGTPVTTHLSYSYQRTLQEWQEAINLGENILKSYGKTVLLTSKNSARQLPDNTQLVLVDRNNHDKAYYATLSTAFTSADHKLTFSNFSSADGQVFSSVSMYDLLSKSAEITAEIAEDGIFVSCDASSATVKTTDGRYYKLKSDSDAGERYNISITPKDSDITSDSILPVEEDYYISFFTPEDSGKTQPMVHIEITSDTRLIDTGMSTPSHVQKNTGATMVFGNLYDQSFSFSTTNANNIINESNCVITAKMSATISLSTQDTASIKGYLANSAVQVYHGFVIDLTRTDESGIEKGVKGSPHISGTYKIGDTAYTINQTCSEAEIELAASTESGLVDLRSQLQTGNSVVISCDDLKIDYLGDTNAIVEQFPARPDGKDYGVTLSAASNIAYVSTNIAYSNITKSVNDSSNRSYYREGNVSTSKLNYNIPSGTADADEFSKLGINGWETPDQIAAVGYYDVSNIPEEELADAKTVSVELSLFQKNKDGNYVSVDMDQYLENIIVYDKDNSAVNGNDYSYSIDVSKLIDGSLSSENALIEIDTSYLVITGDAFEKDDKLYSNYKVQMTAQLLDSNGNAIANSSCSDYIIYTNAKIYAEFLPATEQ